MVAVPGPSPSTAHGVYNSVAPTGADQQAMPLQVDSSGRLLTAAVPSPTPGSASATLGGTFKTVAASGTPERLAASTTLVTSVVLQGYKSQGTANTGNVFIGQGSADGAQQLVLVSGGAISITAPPGKFIDLNLIYVDVATNADGVGYFSVV